MKLTDTQQAIVDSTAARIGVVAVPGSGKTLVLARRAARILAESDTATILVFAFTRAAAAHVKDRITEETRRWYGDGIAADLREPIAREIDNRVRVTTFHAWAYNIVRESHVALGYQFVPRILDDGERSEIVKRIRPTLAHGDKVPLKLIDRVLDDKPVEDPKPGQLETALTIKGLYLAALKESCAIDFHGIIEGARVLMQRKTGIELDGVGPLEPFYDHVFVDEAQDVDGGLWEVLDAMNPPNVFAVGDPLQKAFRWRGGDAAAFTAFCDREWTTKFEMLDNFRSSRQIVDEAERWFARGMTAARGEDFEPVARASCFPSEVDAILARNNATLDAYEIKLKAAGKPFVRLRTRPTPTDAVKLARAYLRARENPYDRESARKCLVAMMQDGEAANREIVRRMLADVPYGDGIVLTKDHLGDEGMAEVATYHELARQGWSPAEYWAAVAMGELEAATPADVPAGAVVLSTFHLAKGKQWPRVAVLTEGLHEHDDDKCLLYIGITRAEDVLYLVA